MSNSEDTKVLSVRMPIERYEALREQAREKGVSLNSLMNQLAEKGAASLGRKCLSPRDFVDIDLDRHVARLRTGSTGEDLNRLWRAMNSAPLVDATFAARPDDLNGRTLVAVVNTEEFTFLMDDTTVNMARRPRAMEVQDFFERVFEAFPGARFFFVPEVLDAGDLAGAIGGIAKEVEGKELKQLTRENVEAYYEVLGMHPSLLRERG